MGKDDMLSLYRHYGYESSLLEDHLRLNFKKKASESTVKPVVEGKEKKESRTLITYELHPDGSVTGYSEEAI